MAVGATNSSTAQATPRKAIDPAASKLFKPLKIGNHELQHRIVFAPLTRYRNDDEHVPMPFVKQYYADRSSAPGTLVITEATAIADAEAGQANSPSFVSDAQVRGWKEVIDAVHAKGGIFFQQIWGMGRASDPGFVASKGYKYHSSSAVRMEGKDAVPVEMTEEEIQQTIRDFVATAQRVVAAGGDGVEIHSAHGYLLDQFISDAVNHRTDRWGGSVENRSRLFLEVVRAVTAAIGAERVAFRFSPYAAFQGATKSDVRAQYLYLLRELKAMRQPFAYMSLVEAKGDPGALIFGAELTNEGEKLDFILEEWDNASPVMVAGGYTAESAAWALEEHYGKWDVVVGFGRHFLANPDLVYRFRKGIELNKYNRATFYINKSETGYNDYPFSKGFLAEQEMNGSA